MSATVEVLRSFQGARARPARKPIHCPEARRTTNPHSTSPVLLREISDETLPAILALSVAPAQQAFVATNARSVEEAKSHPEAWLRAIYANEEPVGLVMLHDEHLLAQPREVGFYYLWRLMIDARFQGRGHGRAAIEALVRHVCSRPHARQLLTSCLPGPGSPLVFYLNVGFERTGREVHGEIELVRPLFGESTD